MSSQPKRVGIRCAQPPQVSLAAPVAMNRMAGNQGNLLYQFSVCRALANDQNKVKIISHPKMDKGTVEERASWINEEFDHLVLPLSSSFRLQFGPKLGEWGSLVEKLDIPVTVVGIGAQLDAEAAERGDFRPQSVAGTTMTDPAAIEEHHANSRRFVGAVLARSNSIGVRGEITKKYLEFLGFPSDQIDVIGCPSVFMWGPGFEMPTNKLKRLGRSTKMATCFDHRLPDMAGLLDLAVKKYPQLMVYAQERLLIKMALTGVDTRPDWDGDDRYPMQVWHPLVQEHRIVFAPTAWAWIEYMKTMDFTFGTRLHGTIAATLAGTSSHLVAHDSRTRELAEYHKMPFTYAKEVDDTTTAQELADKQDYTAFNEHYPELLKRYTDFLERNELPHAYAGDGHGTADQFDQKNATARNAPVVYAGGEAPAAETSSPKSVLRSLLKR